MDINEILDFVLTKCGDMAYSVWNNYDFKGKTVLNECNLSFAGHDIDTQKLYYAQELIEKHNHNTIIHTISFDNVVEMYGDCLYLTKIRILQIHPGTNLEKLPDTLEQLQVVTHYDADNPDETELEEFTIEKDGSEYRLINQSVTDTMCSAQQTIFQGNKRECLDFLQKNFEDYI